MKSWHSLVLIIFSVFMAPTSVFAQKHGNLCGVYRTADDFRANRSDLSIPQGGHPIHPSGFNLDKIKFKVGDSLVNLELKNFWGYCLGEKKVRYYDKKHYQVLDYSNVVIYSHHAPNSGTIHSFSKTLDSPIIKLSKKNLLKEYKDNPRFLALLEAQQGSEDYAYFDEMMKKFRLTYLFEQSMKE
jgi:hypothetical protein